ncbi:hypothetical protein [Neobacillus drentensis]|uniref:hypothetical protein n=1 Tax=Neobacillus drentensis TaxID=220684 RepID=UPI002FFFA4F0
MWFWITISALCFVLLLILEEFIYYFWNRYVYGANYERKRRWRGRLPVASVIFKRLFHKREKEISNTNSDKGLPL